MTFSIHGLAVAGGIAIGRAVLVASSHVDVAHYFIQPEQVEAEIERVRKGRNAVVEELQRLQVEMPADAPHELTALLDVHLMLLQDEALTGGVKHWITERLYNAEWALTTQLEVVARQFDEMEDEYLRERKADLEQVVERILRHMKGVADPVTPSASSPRRKTQQELLLGDTQDVPLVLVAHDLSPADMLHFKQSVFAGFVTDVGGKTSHTAIVARSMGIPAVVGARAASQLVRQDDWVIIDGDTGVVSVDPSSIIFAEYGFRQRQVELERERLARLLHTPAITIDGQRIELLANIEQPGDSAAAVRAGAVGVGLFRSEFLFMGRSGKLPDEDEQYRAYCEAIAGMQGLPVTIRTVDVGADKPLDKGHKDGHLNPALGLRAIRWSLADPAMFRTQLRAVLRAAAHGKVNLLFPMLAHTHEIEQTLAQVDLARAELDARSVPHGPVQLGAMIEVPAAAIMVRSFLKYFDFLSIGTNDLIQYTLAIDRSDEAVAHLYDPLHPAVLRLVADVIAAGQALGKSVCMCGETAGDVGMTRLLLGLGLRSFSMHPAQILAVKQEVLRTDTRKLAAWVGQMLDGNAPAAALAS
ncbi:phosphoenolpyruvate--protein phosphotransferase [Verminephrobacter aporrectodeae subsp. tuberculatae]|uniref:Phosphoenolpyruvate-protein phosphotransferase n=1 Tax=Verminephrobacter aporrectodeae subsp. tuberculatae TaxID=1110392 RepID=A0ABT3KV15_9BURK|nr:phosphoenolpyruvate--protein phosphotransferase [Verminephrobacter aporrectodeae]MCW5223029.1 phosphoenolpyruvate--protein phosphotransferase [Verminephrobacter aporrectodeae subsp. tuberculatae]MCW5288493.1 phosphoenolpyruvate--protein phosphotransferase [Verminephrobacter aporrectodeae subsp. tuberculatae]MCW5322076.1 phosphoenolpyruvate--protein phosphotransferase [Verminephrobacter aporrectodeae subsp. tuberculatae]MCW8197441.1 phosphoenolpyruvate--protein phosphotransferase [Verminephro